MVYILSFKFFINLYYITVLSYKKYSTYQDMQSYINSPNYNLILGYCFGRSDQALRFYTGAGPVTNHTYI
ncbi:hypothetical protein C5468_23135 [Photorhabdus luminescens subsp. mexicana]|uniref:Uncharacterized protein n=1 Tax=Photorhabdus luminescens subsp. mexicana TaxID=2100167 RepID=A0A4R4ITD4_PHOLU|nr:hypothetical protein C5468_23135 [Photorhabdus luminescens subsp. mexicana]